MSHCSIRWWLMHLFIPLLTICIIFLWKYGKITLKLNFHIHCSLTNKFYKLSLSTDLISHDIRWEKLADKENLSSLNDVFWMRCVWAYLSVRCKRKYALLGKVHNWNLTVIFSSYIEPSTDYTYAKIALKKHTFFYASLLYALHVVILSTWVVHPFMNCYCLSFFFSYFHQIYFTKNRINC